MRTFKAAPITLLVTLLAACGSDGGGGNPPPPPNTAPTASNVSIADDNGGDAVSGDSLSGSYTYADAQNDAEGSSGFRWLRDGAAVSGATALTYTLAVADIGTEITFEVTPIAAAGTTTGSAVISGGITVVNQLPLASALSVTVALDTPAAIDVATETGNQLGDAPNTVTATTPANGTTAVSGTSITYTPNPGFVGADSFDYTISDADADAAMATVSITVLDDTLAPTAAIHFPAPGTALTQVNSVLVTGTASDDNAISRVRVAGTDATTSNGFANWRVVLPLAPGSNTLSVETTDEFSNVDFTAAAVTVAFNGQNLETPTDIELDEANGRALAVDDELRVVIAIDLTTGARSILSDNSTPNAADPFDSPEHIVLDAANGRALVVDTDRAAVIAVDLATGMRTIFSNATTPNGTTAFSDPWAIALDAANGRALVTDLDLDAVVAVDLATGARTILSDASTPNTANTFSEPEAIALDAANGRALVADRGLFAVVAVDLATGARTIFSSATIPDSVNPFSDPFDIALDAANVRALVVDRSLDTVLALDLATGTRTILSDANFPDATNLLDQPISIAVDVSNSRALVRSSFTVRIGGRSGDRCTHDSVRQRDPGYGKPVRLPGRHRDGRSQRPGARG